MRTEPGTDRFTEDGIQYLFDGDALERILVEQTEIVFAPALDLTTHDERPLPGDSRRAPLD
ncbi:hypothetical protein [Propioniferax innocua]|uniref:hypothetical protein n=1 Tax=Propioniferax innocua TaxID=1753 RepID=UPI001153549B|nr:hypothetical protein [Propioniferax innocua]